MNATDPASLGHDFRDALAGERMSVIAEVKRRSPSRGDFRLDADPALVARQYMDGGAACLSVLTNREHFGGSPDDLRDARKATGIPVLRKDFLTTMQDVYDSAEMGADAILVILRDVEPRRMREMQDLALELGMDVLTEVRNESELKIAVESGAYMIAVNQREQPTFSEFTVDYGKAERIAKMFSQLDDGIIKVAASGMEVDGGTPLRAIAAAGYDAALIGEALVTAGDRTAALQEMLASCSSHPSVLAAAHS